MFAMLALFFSIDHLDNLWKLALLPNIMPMVPCFHDNLSKLIMLINIVHMGRSFLDNF